MIVTVNNSLLCNLLEKKFFLWSFCSAKLIHFPRVFLLNHVELLNIVLRLLIKIAIDAVCEVREFLPDSRMKVSDYSSAFPEKNGDFSIKFSRMRIVYIRILMLRMCMHHFQLNILNSPNGRQEWYSLT
jgi:hypothetical protein